MREETTYCGYAQNRKSWKAEALSSCNSTTTSAPASGRAGPAKLENECRIRLGVIVVIVGGRGWVDWG